MPRPITRFRKRPIFQVDPMTVPVLIAGGARVITFQKFLGDRQQYMTLIAGPKAHFISCSSVPLPLNIANGKIILDPPPHPPGRYHPS